VCPQHHEGYLSIRLAVTLLVVFGLPDDVRDAMLKLENAIPTSLGMQDTDRTPNTKAATKSDDVVYCASRFASRYRERARCPVRGASGKGCDRCPIATVIEIFPNDLLDSSDRQASRCAIKEAHQGLFKVAGRRVLSCGSLALRVAPTPLLEFFVSLGLPPPRSAL